MSYKNFKNMSKEERQAKAKEGIEARLELLKTGIESLRSSDEYVKYLKFMASFHSYSFRNCIMIMIQKPDAKMVKSYADWKKVGRNVKKGEKGIQILVPAPYKRTVVNNDGEEEEISGISFRSGNVFDISQTEGDDIPRICHKLSGDVEEYDKILMALKEIAKVPVAFENINCTANGYYNTESYSIVIKEGLSQAQTIKTLCHEIGHSILHSENGVAKNAKRDEKELQAESVAYVVSSYLGIDSSDYSNGYLLGWSGGDGKRIEKSLKVISDTAKLIIDKLDSVLS